MKLLHDTPGSKNASVKMALSATLHCLSGCAVGEIIGVIIGSAFGFAPHVTILLASLLSFASGYAASTFPLVRAGMKIGRAFRLVLTADTLSILTMTIVDNVVIISVPGALDKNLAHPVYWLGKLVSLSAAFIVAFPVNLWLLRNGKGHALTHHLMHHD